MNKIWLWVILCLLAWVLLAALFAFIVGPIIKNGEIRDHVKGYQEGRRLMRQGDGADEWIGMDITRKHLLALIDLGCDERGNKVDAATRAEVLRQHGLK